MDKRAALVSSLAQRGRGTAEGGGGGKARARRAWDRPFTMFFSSSRAYGIVAFQSHGGPKQHAIHATPSERTLPINTTRDFSAAHSSTRDRARGSELYSTLRA